MTRGTRANLAASVAARLLNRAKETGDGSGTVKLPPDRTGEYIRTRFATRAAESETAKFGPAGTHEHGA
jgi:hypothetical protein